MPICHFSKIVVLQSLFKDDLKTGKQLFEDIDTAECFHQRGIEVKYYELNCKYEFLTCLEELASEATLGKWPILHIECHGSDDQEGIVLADDTFLSWMELKPYFININKASQFNLIIVLAACNGAYFAKTILPIDRAPCLALIAPTDTVYPDELLTNFTGFYQSLLKTLEGDKALKFLKKKPLKIGGFYVTTAINFFNQVYSGYINKFCTPKQLEIRAGRMFREYKKSVPVRLHSKGWFKRFIKTSRKYYLERHLIHFFMLDLFPQNRTRFLSDFQEFLK